MMPADFVYEFEKHVDFKPQFGPKISIDSCNDGTLWLRADGDGFSLSCSFTLVQAKALAEGLQAAMDAARAAEKKPDVQNVGDMVRAVFNMGGKP